MTSVVSLGSASTSLVNNPDNDKDESSKKRKNERLYGQIRIDLTNASGNRSITVAQTYEAYADKFIVSDNLVFLRIILIVVIEYVRYGNVGPKIVRLKLQALVVNFIEMIFQISSNISKKCITKPQINLILFEKFMQT